MLYQMQEGHLTLDAEWRDQSVNVLVPAQASANGVSLVVARDRLPSDTSLGAYIAGQKQIFQKRLTGFTLLRDVAGALDDRPAHFLEFTWISQGKPLHQMVTAVDDKGGLLNFTASIPGTAAADTRRLLLEAIRSFKFGAAATDRPGGAGA